MDDVYAWRCSTVGNNCRHCYSQLVMTKTNGMLNVTSGRKVCVLQ